MYSISSMISPLRLYRPHCLLASLSLYVFFWPVSSLAIEIEQLGWADDDSTIVWKLVDGSTYSLSLVDLVLRQTDHEWSQPEFDESDWDVGVSNQSIELTSKEGDESVRTWHFSVASVEWAKWIDSQNVLVAWLDGNSNLVLTHLRIYDNAVGESKTRQKDFAFENGGPSEAVACSESGRYLVTATKNEQDVASLVFWDLLQSGPISPVMKVFLEEPTSCEISFLSNSKAKLELETPLPDDQTEMKEISKLCWSRDARVSDYACATIRDHLESLPDDVRHSARYFIDTQRWLNGCHQKIYRSRILNSLLLAINYVSWDPNLASVEPIDDLNTIFYINLADLKSSDGSTWSADTWRRIAELEPCPLLPGLDEDAAGLTTGFDRIAVKADWFVWASTQPPLYYDLLGLPQSERGLERLLLGRLASVDLDAPDSELPMRVLAVSGEENGSGTQPSDRHRVLERHAIPAGSNGHLYKTDTYYWKSYDFRTPTSRAIDRRSIVPQYPLGPELDTKGFRRAAGEMIFGLPNGMQGYFICDQFGTRLDEAPIDIVSNKMYGRIPVISSGASCITCHSAGILPAIDRLRPILDSHPEVFGSEAEDLLRLHRPPEELQEAFRRDTEQYRGQDWSSDLTNSITMDLGVSLSPLEVAQQLGIRGGDLPGLILELPSDLRRSLALLLHRDGKIERRVFHKLARKVRASILSNSENRVAQHQNQ